MVEGVVNLVGTRSFLGVILGCTRVFVKHTCKRSHSGIMTILISQYRYQ